MEYQVLKVDGTKSSKMKLDDSVFGINPNHDVVFRAVQAELTNSRHGTHASKTRGMVSGGGKKPWKQKHTGRARHGSNRSPLWKGGGTVFGPQPHAYTYNLPKKMKALARRSVLSDKTKNGNMVIVDELKVNLPKTKEFVQILQALNIEDKKVTVLIGEFKNELSQAARNISNVAVLEAANASTYDLIDNDVVLFDQHGIEKITSQLMVK